MPDDDASLELILTFLNFPAELNKTAMAPLHYTIKLDTLQSSVKTYLPGFGNGWLKYCATVQNFGVGSRTF